MRYVLLVSSQNCWYAPWPWRDVIPCPESLRARWSRRPLPKVDPRLLVALLLQLLRSALAWANLRSWVAAPAGHLQQQFVGPLPRRLQQPWWPPVLGAGSEGGWSFSEVRVRTL